MSKYRQAAKVDANQPEIVDQLRALPGVTVEPGHDDILIGYRGRNYWIEIKDPAKTLRQDGRIRPGTFKQSQVDLMRDWQGQYNAAWVLEEILEIIGFKSLSL